MALVNKEIPAIILGVSQQTPAKRSDGHVSEAVNMSFTAVKGATSRPPTTPATLNNLPITGLTLGTTPTLTHNMERDVGDSYILLITQHDANGVALPTADIKVISSDDGFVYSTSVDTDAIDYISTASTTPSRLSALTLNDTTFISNKDVIPAMVPAPTSVLVNEALITVNNVPLMTQTQSTTPAEAKLADVTLTGSKRGSEPPSLLADGSNLQGFIDPIDKEDASLWVLDLPHEMATNALNGASGIYGQASFDPDLAIEAYRNGLLRNLLYKGYSSARETSSPFGHVLAGSLPMATTSDGHLDNAMQSMPVTEWPTCTHPGYTRAFGGNTIEGGGNLWVLTPADYEARTSTGSFTIERAVIWGGNQATDEITAGVSVHVGAFELLYTNKPTANSLNDQALFGVDEGQPGTEVDQTTMLFYVDFKDVYDPVTAGLHNFIDRRLIYVTFDLVLEPDGNDVNYYHYRSRMPTAENYEYRITNTSHLDDVPALRHGSFNAGGPGVPYAATPDLGNKWFEITNLQNRIGNAGSITPNNVDRGYSFFDIHPPTNHTSWSGNGRAPDYVWYDPGIDLAGRTIVGGVSKDAGDKYRNRVTGTGGSEWYVPLVYGMGTGFKNDPADPSTDSPYLMRGATGANFSGYQNRSDSLSGQTAGTLTPFDYPAWEWLALGKDQIYGYSLTKHFPNFMPCRTAPGTLQSFDHPGYTPVEADRDSNLRLANISTSDVSVITSHYGVATIADLPYRAPDNFVTRIIGDADSEGDEFYLKYDITSESWSESRTVEEAHSFDTTTMPHILRRIPDSSSPRGVKFVLSAGSVLKDTNLHASFPNPTTSQWAERLVGDDANAPPPSFIGSGISEMFFYRNRLCFVSGGDLNLTEASEPFNFFKTSLQTNVESDPIDLTVNHSTGALLDIFAAVPLPNGVMLFDRNEQFVLKSDEGQPFSNKTAHVVNVSSYPVTDKSKPIFLGNRVLWMSEQGESLRVWEYYPGASSAQYEDITMHIPTYIPTGGRELLGSENDSMILLRTDGAEQSLFVYQYMYSNGEKLQQAWSRWDFGAKIIHAHFNRGVIKLILQRTTIGNPGYFLENLDLTTSPDVAGVKARLDSKITFKASDGTAFYNQFTGFTQLTQPSVLNWAAGLHLSPNTVALSGENTPTPGESHTILPINANSVAIAGDHTGVNNDGIIYTGTQYEQSLELSPFFLRSNDRRMQAQINRESGRTQLKTLAVSYEESGLIASGVNRQGVASSQISEQADLYPGVIMFDINGQNTTTSITLSSATLNTNGDNLIPTWMPMTITGLRYEVQYHTRGKSIK